jgi:hypothetical protein
MSNATKHHNRSTRCRGKRSEHATVKPFKFNSLWSVYAEAPKHNRIAFITEQLHSAGVDIHPDVSGARHIVVNKGRNNRLSSLANDTIGSIVNIEADAIKLVSYMTPAPQRISDNDFARVTRSFDQYTVYQINDGTTLGLYWYNNEWVIRSLNGFDVSKYEWNGLLTYQEVFDEVMSMYPNFSINKLEKNKCYTIGIKHSLFHPFMEGQLAPIKRAWFIQSVDVEKVTAQHGRFDGAVSSVDDIGIPIQSPLSGQTLCDIMTKKSQAYNAYMNTGEIYHGVILATTTESLMIQSDLFTTILSIFYINNYNRNIAIGSYDRKKYLVLSVYLDNNQNKYNCFRNLFPQFCAIIKQFETTKHFIVNAMVKCIENKSAINNTEVTKDIKFQSLFDDTIQSLLRQLSNRAGGFPKLDVNIMRMLNRFVHSSSHVSTLYDLMYYVKEPDTGFTNETIADTMETITIQLPEGTTQPLP